MKRLNYFIAIVFCLALCVGGCGLGKKANSDVQSRGISVEADKAPLPEWVEYINKPDGYCVEVPGNWTIDTSREGTVTRLIAAERTGAIDIYAQPLKKLTISDYLDYSNRKILKQELGVKVLEQSRKPVKKAQAYRITWQRPKIINRTNDLNLYREIDLIMAGTVYTFVLKTDSEHLAQYEPLLDHIIDSFKAESPKPPAAIQAAAVVPRDINLVGEKMSLTIPKNQMVFGIFNPTFYSPQYDPELAGSFNKYEESLSYKFEFLMTYIDFRQSFPQAIVDQAYSEGRLMMLTWQPIVEPGLEFSGMVIPAIINGDYDAYIKDWAVRMKAIREPVFLRFANEMNGDWDPWCAWFYSKDADLYIDAWKHIHKLFKQEGADNVLFVWNPHDRTYPDFKWNQPEVYYPGADFVDWVGLTCYNNGTSYPDDVWRNFNAMYRPVYDEYLLKYPGKPFMITEFSCNEVGGDKKAWLEDCFSSLKNYPNIRIAVWFDKTDGKWLYRIDSSAAAKEAFRQGLSDPYYLRNAVRDFARITNLYTGKEMEWDGGRFLRSQ